METKQIKNTQKVNNISNPFMLKKRKQIKERIMRDIWTLFNIDEGKIEKKKLQKKKQ